MKISDFNIKKMDPALHDWAYSRRFQTPKGFSAFEEIVKFHLGNMYAMSNPRYAEHVNDNEDVSLSSNYACTNVFFSTAGPVYWVSSSLLEAAMRTTLPASLRMEDVPLPAPSGIYMLPKGQLKMDGSNLDHILFGWPEKNKEYRPICRDTKYPYSVTTKKGLLWTTYSPETDCMYGGKGYGEGLVSDAFDKFPQHIEENYAEFGVPNDGGVVSIPTLLIKLMLLTAEPGLLSEGTVIRRVKAGKKKKINLWSPNWVGYKYNHKRELKTGQGNTHASPRLHWRRGHYRMQPHGPLTERKVKTIWIAPVLIGAENER